LKINDFKKQEPASRAPDRDKVLEQRLRDYFGGEVEFDWSVRGDHYKHDLDVLWRNEKVRVEEKRRQKDYGDELIEVVSNNQTGRLGWIERAHGFDLLVNHYPERISVWPAHELVLAYEIRGWAWCAQYGCKPAYNREGYYGLHLAIPTKVLAKAVIAAGANECKRCKALVTHTREVCFCGSGSVMSGLRPCGRPTGEPTSSGPREQSSGGGS